MSTTLFPVALTNARILVLTLSGSVPHSTSRQPRSLTFSADRAPFIFSSLAVDRYRRWCRQQFNRRRLVIQIDMCVNAHRRPNV
jgi:hypothetical protein